MKRRNLYLLIVILVLFLVMVRFVSEIGREEPGRLTVIRVIDGDTMVLNGDEQVRLLGIDTPEKGEPFADSATVFLAHLVVNREVTLKHDFRKRDNYGRLLAYVYVDDTLLVNAALVAEGLARVYLFPDDIINRPLIDGLIAAQRRALAANRGVWSVPVRAEERYIANRRTMRFHRPDCRSVGKTAARNQVVFDTREAALYEGYSPCRNCQP
ncbi:MAG: thermonuclease family protein [candidate division Zixibacteria bacterium]|nr:thermonuclease family protein [candidate division Zixibacteria bacterium]